MGYHQGSAVLSAESGSATFLSGLYSAASLAGLHSAASSARLHSAALVTELNLAAYGKARVRWLQFDSVVDHSCDDGQKERILPATR